LSEKYELGLAQEKGNNEVKGLQRNEGV